MLDDLAYIHQKDRDDALGSVEKQGQQLALDFAWPTDAKIGFIDQIMVAGMGGSALSALMVQSWPALKVPLRVVREYELPAPIDQKTLVVCSSYSGNTEETLAVLDRAEAVGAQIVCLAAGGALQERAAAKGHPFIALPPSGQPRYQVLASYKALLTVFDKVGVLAEAGVLQQVTAAAPFINQAVAGWRADVPAKNNPAKHLAQELIGKSVVIYSGPKLWPAAYKWKISLNENAKQIAWANQLPEFNHNEFIGWSQQPVDKPYAVIDIRSRLEHPRVQKRFEVSERLLSGMRPSPLVVTAEGQTILEQLLWTAALGDFVSIYVGLLNGLNPAPVDLVERFKRALDEDGQPTSRQAAG